MPNSSSQVVIYYSGMMMDLVRRRTSYSRGRQNLRIILKMMLRTEKEQLWPERNIFSTLSLSYLPAQSRLKTLAQALQPQASFFLSQVWADKSTLASAIVGMWKLLSLDSRQGIQCQVISARLSENLICRKILIFLSYTSRQYTHTYSKNYMECQTISAGILPISILLFSRDFIAWIYFTEQHYSCIRILMERRRSGDQLFSLIFSLRYSLKQESCQELKLGSEAIGRILDEGRSTGRVAQLLSALSSKASRNLPLMMVSSALRLWEISLPPLVWKMIKASGRWRLILGAESMQQLVMKENKLLVRVLDSCTLRQEMMISMPSLFCSLIQEWMYRLLMKFLFSQSRENSKKILYSIASSYFSLTCQIYSHFLWCGWKTLMRWLRAFIQKKMRLKMPFQKSQLEISLWLMSILTPLKLTNISRMLRILVILPQQTVLFSPLFSAKTILKICLTMLQPPNSSLGPLQSRLQLFLKISQISSSAPQFLKMSSMKIMSCAYPIT